MSGLKQKSVRIVGGVVLMFLCVATLLAASPVTGKKIYRKLQLFAQVLSAVERFYVEPVNDEALLDGAIQGMMRTLDPHSALLSPSDFALLEADTRGEFGGVGLEVGIKDDRITVISPMDDSPASRAKIAPGDRLVAVDGLDVATMSIEEAVRRMRGKVGTVVKATFFRPGEKSPFEVTLVREIIRVKSVVGEMLLPGFAWIRVRLFQDGTAAEVKATLRHFDRAAGPLKGIVLDLRRNPGGVLDEAVRLADLFLDKGVIVSTKRRGGEVMETFNAHRLGTIRELPTAVLIDEASASAAEIVAGALQDRGRAMVVGRRSFGKGSVQSILGLEDGYGLKLTIARYYTPSGRSIQSEGIVPDILAESDVPAVGTENAFPSEADLPGSLAAAGTPPDTPTAAARIEDYPLRIALELVSGLSRERSANQ